MLLLLFIITPTPTIAYVLSNLHIWTGYYTLYNIWLTGKFCFTLSYNPHQPSNWWHTLPATVTGRNFSLPANFLIAFTLFKCQVIIRCFVQFPCPEKFLAHAVLKYEKSIFFVGITRELLFTWEDFLEGCLKERVWNLGSASFAVK